MQIELNAMTRERLEQSLAGKPGQFKMFYDTEDCGCNGVLVIQVVSEPSPTDIVFQTEPFTFLCDRQQEVLFDDVMRLEAEAGYPAYKLTSDSTLFGSNIRVQDARS
ncbi:iron-sulfur cluster biosynthesis family protein [Paenibacillus sp. FSL H3-0469]|uniref:iron-sulfur cluster biosynthesis family protein n=1 Tax=Paenibacillus sp. FSL H3-0469 TaxID=2954506 RepID=UPI003100E070